MHFLLLGASGRTGQHVVSELLSQGHTAVALVRNPSSLSPRPGLTIVTGTPLSKTDIQKTLTAAPSLSVNAAIITLNTVRTSDNPFAAQVSSPRFLADSCANACEVLEQADIRRIVVMSTAGVGDSWANLSIFSKAIMGWTNIKHALEDHGIVDREMRLRSQMEWTLVRPVRLRFDDQVKGTVRTLGNAGEKMRMSDLVGTRDVARFMVEVAVEGRFVREAVAVAD